MIRHKLLVQKSQTAIERQATLSVREGQSPLSVPWAKVIKLKSNPYNYRRKLPHYQHQSGTLFVTFRKLSSDPLSEGARGIVLQHCLHDHGSKLLMHAAIVMPEHVHLLFTPLRNPEGWAYPSYQILKLIKGTSAHSVNRLLGRDGPLWQDESFDHVLRSAESLEDKLEYIRQNPVRRGLVEKPQDYPWLWVGI